MSATLPRKGVGLPSEAAAFDGLDHAGTLEFVAVVADSLGCDTCDAL
jgi:hypothetical protein